MIISVQMTFGELPQERVETGDSFTVEAQRYRVKWARHWNGWRKGRRIRGPVIYLHGEAMESRE